ADILKEISADESQCAHGGNGESRGSRLEQINPVHAAEFSPSRSAASYDETHNHETEKDDEEQPQGDRVESSLDELADKLAIKVNESANYEEAGAARDNRSQDENDEIEMGKAAEDRDELVRNRREALDQDHPEAPLGELRFEVLGAIA